ncbi:interleukin-31 receptor subunit alpha-like isoform X2 [Brachyhypopomus gauderio]|uniref:interleukin-31 receptor subunit alpha-like isoform X2 n=1 Tax=Brachyhypopomus gauderio TaxID=698409 RepID=UPI0040431922
MWTPTFIMVLVLQVMCKGQELCEIIPGNQNIRFGSDIIVSLKASPNSDCRNRNAFNTSRVYWTLNSKRIAKTFYHSNSTVASVSIRNFSLARGLIECFFDGDILGGVNLHSYYLLSRPRSVSCVAKVDFKLSAFDVTCNWDLDNTKNTHYTVYFKQGSDVKICTSTKKSCTFHGELGPIPNENITITVKAENPVSTAYSDSVSHYGFWSIVQIDRPNVNVEPGLNVLRGHWKNNYFSESDIDCHVHFAEHENVSYTEPVELLKNDSTREFSLTGVKPCTNYTISVCCKLKGSIWSTCQNVSVLSSTNVSYVQLWRSKSLLSGQGKRVVHLMWKGIPASCNAFDEYRLFDETHNSKFVASSFKPSQNHTFCTLDDKPHRLCLAVFRKGGRLSKTCINVPSTEKDFPALHNVTALTKDCQIHVTWDKPTSAVTGYLIVWNSTHEDFLWQQTQETQFSLKGEPFTLYTISVSPFYERGPGDEVRLHKYVQEGEPPRVSEVSVKWISDKQAEIQWVPALHIECCAFVVNYTVIYTAHNDPRPRYVTVGKNQQSVVLDDLRPGTVYSVYVVANSMASSSNSDTKQFSTKVHELEDCHDLIHVFYCLYRRRKYLFQTFPNPRRSSLSVWSLQNHRTHWNPLTLPWDFNSEKVLPCQLDTEAVGVSPGSRRELTLKAWRPAQGATRHQEDATLACYPITVELPSGGKQETSHNFPSMGVNSPGDCPMYFSQTYRNQTTPQLSPVETCRRPCPLEERERLLKAKPQKATLDPTYVAVEVFACSRAQNM